MTAAELIQHFVDELLSEGKPEDVVAALSGRIDQTHATSELWKSYALALALVNRHEESLAAYYRALEINPADDEALIQIVKSNMNNSHRESKIDGLAVYFDRLSEANRNLFIQSISQNVVAQGLRLEDLADDMHKVLFASGKCGMT